jgi:hypothetical protein
MNQDELKDVFKKGIMLGPIINKDWYICPETGAHFEWQNMCKRLNIMNKQRFIDFKLL